MSPIKSSILISALSIAAIAGLIPEAKAGFWEISGGFNYSRSEYTGGSYSWNRRYGGSIGFNFSDSSTLEFACQRSKERNHYEGFEDSTYVDEVCSVNLVWNLLDRTSLVQPYLKGGAGQLVRNANIVNSTGQGNSTELSEVTVVMGAGLKIHLTQTFGLRLEGTSFMPKAKLSTWKQNFGVTFGGSIYF